MQRVERRRNFAALGLSLAVHALVVAWLLLRPAPPPEPPAPKPLAKLVWLDAKAPAVESVTGARGDSPGPEGAEAAGVLAGASSAHGAVRSAHDASKSASDAQTASKSGQAASTTASRRSAPNPAQDATKPTSVDDVATSARDASSSASAHKPSASAAAEPSAVATAPGGPETLGTGDDPRAMTLVPGVDVLGTEATGAPAGRTLYPSDMPGADELLAEESARVHDRVDGFARGATAAARVRGGLPDPAYGALGAALREATAEVPKFIDTDSPKEVGAAFVDSWQSGAARYGATGAPYAEPEGRLESFEKPSALADAVARGSPDGIALAQFFAAGARLQEFADGRAGAELYALVEIRQQASGAVDSVTLLRPSGVVPFDRWVTERANTVAIGFAADAGARAKPYRSLWRFDGIVTFRRKLKLSELDARAAVGMMTMAALSMLSGIGNTGPAGTGGSSNGMGPRMPAFTGRFDEVTGEMDMVDLTNPQYDCRVTLLEAD